MLEQGACRRFSAFACARADGAVQDGSKVFASGADNAVRALDLQANPNQAQQVAQHDAPIKAAKWVETPQGGILVTGSWDKTVKVRRLGMCAGRARG